MISYPSSPEVSTILSELTEELYFFTADRDSQTMSGYRVVTTPPSKELSTALVWTLRFPAESERIISTVLKSPNGEVQLCVVVLAQVPCPIPRFSVLFGMNLGRDLVYQARPFFACG